VALTIVDLLTTGLGIALGGQEGNAVPIFLLGHLSFAGLVAVKLGYCMLAALILAFTARFYVLRARVLGIACCAIAAIVAGHNLLVLMSLLAAR
jgi:hypothetical protein